MSKEVLAWIAGFLDGEGTFAITRSKARNTIDYNYRVSILAVNTHYESLVYIKKKVGLGIIYSNRQSNPNWNPIHRYQCVSAGARKLAKMLSPYLIIKQEHADIVASFPVRDSYKRSAEMKAKQAEMYERIHHLNTRKRKILI